MKTSITLIAVAVFLLPVFGKSQTTNPGPQPTNEPTVYKGVTDDACAVEVSFGSPGSVIDGKAFEKVMLSLAESVFKSLLKITICWCLIVVCTLHIVLL